MKKALTIQNFWQIKYPSNVMFNPSGTAAVFQLAQADKSHNNYSTDIWLTVGGKVKRLTASKNSILLGWLNDFEVVLSRADKEAAAAGRSELYKIAVDGGEAVRIAVLPFVVSSVKVVDETHLMAAGMIDAGQPDLYKATDKQRQQYFAALKKDSDYQVIDELPYYYNNVGYVNKKRTALFAVSLKPFKTILISQPDETVDDYAIGPDCVYAAVTTYTRQLNRFGRIVSYNLKTGRKAVLYDKGEYTLGRLFYWQDTLYVTASDEKKYGINQTGNIYRADKNGLQLVYDNPDTIGSSMSTDCCLGGGEDIQPAGNWLYMIVQRQWHNEIIRFDSQFKPASVVKADGALLALAVSGEKILTVAMLDGLLGEVYSCKASDGSLKRLTGFNSGITNNYYTADYQQLAYQQAGYDLTGWVLLPQGYNKSRRYPAILDIHGGPRAAYGPVFYFEMQLWASRGYIVMFTNPVGGDGFGDEFADIRGDYGNRDYQCLMKFTDEVLKKCPNIDPDRLGVTGGSYGGFMTNWIIGHTDRFAVAVSQRSIANWTSFTYTSDIGPWFGPDQNGADINTNLAKVWHHSPLAYAKNAKTPTLFIHSDQDYRCPLSEGSQMLQALLENEIEARMVIFKGENHELSRSGAPVHRVRRLEEITGWFDAHLQKKTGGKKRPAEGEK